MPTADASSLDIDARVEAFESRMAQGQATVTDIADYLPDSYHPERLDLLVELLRVALELDWTRGHKPRIEEYLALFPEVATSPPALKLLAFEEYRLRSQAGERLTPSDYQTRFSLPQLSWPTLLPSEERWQSFARSSPVAAAQLELATRSLPDIGDEFAEFELLSELGRGAFARVFLARQKSLAGRLVALKITAGTTGEPQHLARLQHGNIVPVFSAHAVGPLTGLCMPYLGNTTLADVIRSVWRTHRPLTGSARRDSPRSGKSIVSTLHARRSLISTVPGSPSPTFTAPAPTPTTRLLDQLEAGSYADAIARLLARVADGLAHAHDRGIIHHDIKPANILLADDGEPLILDFNLASHSAPESAGLAIVGGTLPYMAPEQLRNLLLPPSTTPTPAHPCDPRSDLFSLGVVLYELLTGSTPHPVNGGTMEAITRELLAAWNSPRPAPLATHPTVTPALAAITAKCLALEPAARYQSARELAEDLRRQLAHQPLRFAAEGWTRERARKWARRHPRLTSATSVGLVATLLLAGLSAAWLARGQQLQYHAAQEQLQQFEAELPAARVMLAPGVRLAAPAIADQGVTRGQALLARYGIDPMHAPDIAHHSRQSHDPLFEPLDPVSRQRLQRELRSLARLLAAALPADSPVAPTAAHTSPAENSPDDDPLLAAFSRLHAGDDAGATQALQDCLRHSPRDAAAWLALGYCHVRQGELEQADVAYSMCAALAPALPLPGYFRGLTRLERKRYADARLDFSAMLEHHPDFAAAYFHRGVASQGLGDHAAAVADFSRALSLGFPHTRTYFLRSRSLAALGQTQAAQSDRETGLQRTPGDSASWIARGLEKLPTDAPGAAADFRSALALEPHSPLALANLAHALAERLGQTDESVEILGRWIDSRPTDPLPHGSRGVLRARQGAAAAAIADAEAALTLSNSPFTRYQAACVFALLSPQHSESVERALHLLALALQEQPALAREMQRDPDLAPLRDHPQFHRLLAAATTLLEPPATPPGK
ncbi:MAG: serine/threonine-protein kinase [Pirellulales bacterium]